MQDKNFIRSLFRNGPSDLLIRKPAALLSDNGVNKIIFLSTPITMSIIIAQFNNERYEKGRNRTSSQSKYNIVKS